MDVINLNGDIYLKLLDNVEIYEKIDQLASHSGREGARSPRENGTGFRRSPIVSCYKLFY
jgi:hypothetical protein